MSYKPHELLLCPKMRSSEQVSCLAANLQPSNKVFGMATVVRVGSPSRRDQRGFMMQSLDRDPERGPARAGDCARPLAARGRGGAGGTCHLSGSPGGAVGAGRRGKAGCPYP